MNVTEEMIDNNRPMCERPFYDGRQVAFNKMKTIRRIVRDALAHASRRPHSRQPGALLDWGIEMERFVERIRDEIDRPSVEADFMQGANATRPDLNPEER